MGLGSLLILTQVCVYLLAFLLTFFIFIPVAVNVGEFDHHCLLYASGTWNASDMQLYGVQWGDPGYCNITIFMGVVTLPLSLFYLLWLSVYLFKGIDPTWLAAFGNLVTSLVTTVLMFVCGCIISGGFNHWCSQLGMPCELADEIHFATEKDIYTRHFYVEFGMAQFGVWTAFICWFVLTTIAAIRMHQYHRDENFLISMSRERQRLLQKISPSSDMI